MTQELDPPAGAYLLRSLVNSIDSGRLEAPPALVQRLRAALGNLESISNQVSDESTDSDSASP